MAVLYHKYSSSTAYYVVIRNKYSDFLFLLLAYLQYTATYCVAYSHQCKTDRAFAVLVPNVVVATAVDGL